MWRYFLVNFLLSMAVASPCMAQQRRDYTTEAGVDSDGNIYVVSDAAKRIKMVTVGHCIEAKFADDKQTVGCSVARGTKPEEAMQSLVLEIYLRNGKKQIIETETPMDWHFWRGGQQVAVYFHSADGNGGRYALYEAASAHLVEELAEPGNESLLPEWAKGPTQIQDDSVPVGDEYNRERAKWIAKVLRQIEKIKPGMKRQDLLKVFTIEGGLSTRFLRTYVLFGMSVHKSQCPIQSSNQRIQWSGRRLGRHHRFDFSAISCVERDGLVQADGDTQLTVQELLRERESSIRQYLYLWAPGPISL